jgi:FkbM family methyltransferase
MIIDNNLGISDVNGKKILTIDKLTSTSSMSEINENSFFLKLKNFLLRQKNKKETYEVKTSTIDNYFKDFDLKDSLLKIDVEGHELKVLRGAKNTIKEIDFILIENQFMDIYKDNKIKECDDFLKSNQFDLIKKFVFPTFHFEDRLYKNKLK